MSKRIEFLFDVGSPAAYLAWTQLPTLAREEGADLAMVPMLLGGVFQATGNASPAAVAAKGRYFMIDYARFAKRYGVPFAYNPHFPVNTLVLMRMLAGAQMTMPDRFHDLLAVTFRALWVDGANFNDAQVVGRVLAGAGHDAEALMALAGDQAVKDRLRGNTEQAVARGVFGAPTCFVGDEMFFGQDRLDFVREAVRG